MTDDEALVNRAFAECVAAMISAGMTLADAQEAVAAMAKKAYESARKRTNAIYTQGRGDENLQREATDAALHAAFEKRRAEGVTDDDIRWWWNMSVFEQEMIVQQDDIIRMSMYVHLRNKGMEPTDVVKEVFKCHVKWGDPTEEAGDDRPLPYEMKHRIVSYIEKFYDDPAELQERIAGESSFNALVRKEIKHGNL